MLFRFTIGVLCTPIAFPVSASFVRARPLVIMVSPNDKSPWRVVVTRRLPPAAMEMLQNAEPSLELDIWDSDDQMPRDEMIKRVSQGTDALLCVLTDKVDSELLDAAGSRLSIVSTISVGFNHIDVKECQSRSIFVCNTPSVLTETTADTAVGLVLAACRRFKEASASVYDGTWGTWTLMGYCGMDVHSSTVGIVGLGRIGAAVARRLKAFNCKLLYNDRFEMPHNADPVGAKFTSLDELLKESDIVISVCPLMPETTGLFDADKFSKMKKTAVFVNPARGELVNQGDLIDALNNGEIFSAGLDVTIPEPIDPEHPLAKCPNCFILPHIGSASKATRTAMATLGVRNVLAAYKGEDLTCQVKM